MLITPKRGISHQSLWEWTRDNTTIQPTFSLPYCLCYVQYYRERDFFLLLSLATTQHLIRKLTISWMLRDCLSYKSLQASDLFNAEISWDKKKIRWKQAKHEQKLNVKNDLNWLSSVNCPSLIFDMEHYFRLCSKNCNTTKALIQIDYCQCVPSCHVWWCEKGDWFSW